MVLSGECAAPSGRRIGPFRLVDSAVTMAPAALWILGWLHIAQLDGLSSCHYLVLFFAVGLRSRAELKIAPGTAGSQSSYFDFIEQRSWNYPSLFPLTWLIALTNRLK